MIVLVTCKNEEDPIKTEASTVLTRLYVDFTDTQGQPNDFQHILLVFIIMNGD